MIHNLTPRHHSGVAKLKCVLKVALVSTAVIAHQGSAFAQSLYSGETDPMGLSMPRPARGEAPTSKPLQRRTDATSKSGMNQKNEILAPAEFLYDAAVSIDSAAKNGKLTAVQLSNLAVILGQFQKSVAHRLVDSSNATELAPWNNPLEQFGSAQTRKVAENLRALLVHLDRSQQLLSSLDSMTFDQASVLRPVARNHSGGTTSLIAPTSLWAALVYHDFQRTVSLVFDTLIQIQILGDQLSDEAEGLLRLGTPPILLTRADRQLLASLVPNLGAQESVATHGYLFEGRYLPQDPRKSGPTSKLVILSSSPWSLSNSLVSAIQATALAASDIIGHQSYKTILERDSLSLGFRVLSESLRQNARSVAQLDHAHAAAEQALSDRPSNHPYFSRIVTVIEKAILDPLAQSSETLARSSAESEANALQRVINTLSYNGLLSARALNTTIAGQSLITRLLDRANALNAQTRNHLNANSCSEGAFQ